MDENFLLNLETCIYCLELIDNQHLYRCKKCRQVMHIKCIKSYIKKKNKKICINCENNIADISIDIIDNSINDISFCTKDANNNEFYLFIKGLCCLLFCFILLLLFIFFINK